MTVDNSTAVRYACPSAEECEVPDCKAECHETHWHFMKRKHETEDCPAMQYLRHLE